MGDLQIFMKVCFLQSGLNCLYPDGKELPSTYYSCHSLFLAMLAPFLATIVFVPFKLSPFLCVPIPTVFDALCTILRVSLNALMGQGLLHQPAMKVFCPFHCLWDQGNGQTKQQWRQGVTLKETLLQFYIEGNLVGFLFSLWILFSTTMCSTVLQISLAPIPSSISNSHLSSILSKTFWYFMPDIFTKTWEFRGAVPYFPPFDVSVFA